MDNIKKDIENRDDIKLMVDNFYSKIREDDLLSNIFNSVIQDRWPQHLEKMYTFWETLLFDVYTYNGQPFVPHANLPVEQYHFERWVSIFNQNLDELFAGPVADEARWRAARMASVFSSKIDYLRKLQASQ